MNALDPKSSGMSNALDVTFEQMCNFAAITEIGKPSETLQKVILQCFAILPNEKFESASDLCNAIQALFGLLPKEHEVQDSVNSLIQQSQIIVTNGYLSIPLSLRSELQQMIDDSAALENRVRDQWWKELHESGVKISSEDAWIALKAYLTRAFKRHGVQAVGLLDPAVQVSPEYAESLSTLLHQAVQEVFPEEEHNTARLAISGFLSNVGKFPDRATYIAQLGDSTFNYFLFSVSPEVSEQFRKQLRPLVLFLDTNFLLGILDLHVGSQVQVSQDLISSIEEHHLPFRLRYHERTQREMQFTIDHYRDVLGSQSWNQALSKVAISAHALSGIELRYHTINSQTPVDANTFLQPYNHIDVLLSDKNIDIYRPNSDRLYQRANLHNDYSDYLRTKGKEKVYELVDHDITVLDTVRSLRSNAKSSLDAGALLVTCDYWLYKFDWDTARADHRQACVVLPNLFWQILRPFISADPNFDRSFAETFAIPEFRSIGSGASRACSKMLCLLAAYKEIPIETAAHLLSNDMLIDKLRVINDDKQFQTYVESAIIKENEILLEEKAAIEKQIEEEKTARTRDKLEAERKLKEKDDHIKEIESRLREKEKKASEGDNVIVQKEMDEGPQIEANTEHFHRLMEIYKAITGIVVSAVLILLFLYIVHSYNWEWMLNHTHAIGLQIAFCVFMVSVFGGLFYKEYRKFFWGAVGFGILGIVIQII